MEFELLTRRGCGLCDELAGTLAAVLAARAAQGERVTVVERDVDSDAALARRFGVHVPVLRVGGEVLCAHRFDAERVAAALAGRPWEPLELR